MKRLVMLAVSVVVLSSVHAARAQTCDLEGSVTISYAGQPDSKATAIAYGISKAEIERLHARALKVVDVASKVQDKKGGEHMIEFDETRRCGDKVTKGEGVAGVMVQGVTLKGANRIAREFEHQLSQEIAHQEQRAAHGKKRALGRD